MSQATAESTAGEKMLGGEGESETSSVPACRSGGVEDATQRAEGGSENRDCKATARNAQNRVKMLRLLSKVSLVCQRLCFIVCVCVCACASASNDACLSGRVHDTPQGAMMHAFLGVSQ